MRFLCSFQYLKISIIPLDWSLFFLSVCIGNSKCRYFKCQTCTRPENKPESSPAPNSVQPQANFMCFISHLFSSSLNLLNALVILSHLLLLQHSSPLAFKLYWFLSWLFCLPSQPSYLKEKVTFGCCIFLFTSQELYKTS